ncbi:YceI family protein [Myxococcus sp. MISCRS1]|jgi:polyisoprenoid-binding protein YceI|uniref:YceI family protein n=1 Tax=Myxococcus TaxID=32 RepID=UPI001CBC2F24|nr:MULTISPECIES: YceI family protein [Myxococcus]BDT35673.1 YceI family protein [Myxococcus sp. MH1]MBZ4401251.1 YceI family protein [Myxococcus sp. AS-1-15]MBZ4414108.1 YceI family protein [Myxococcus sp. XM-1-1-1]MCK8502929.1 YceI family protein [Myxococcus fulvus]MCY1002756.1 YceI family protein [Myxococcus sp. MISCRS1]
MPVTSWNIDPAHSTVLFIARHMVVARVHGRFERISGSLRVDPEQPTRGEVEVSADTASIYTGAPERDAHLRSPDFLDAEAAPKLTFRSTHVEPTGGASFRLSGELSIRNVTQPVVFEARHTATSKDPWGSTRLIYTARATINRSDYGIRWNKTLDNGGWLVGEKVDIELDIQAIPAAS